MRSAGPKVLAAVASLTALAALLRFTNLGLQSLWVDEALTAWVLDPSPIDTFDNLADREATPPLYYALAWLWTRVLGEGDVALRSLSALLGTATVPVAYLAAKELVSRRAGLIAAGLVATSPYLIWYSQEARSYALASLLAAASLLFLARALRDERPRHLALWAAVSALLCWTQYFAILLVGAEALWLLRRRGLSRSSIVAVAVPALALLLVAPLALHQRGDGRTDWVDDTALGDRVSETVRSFVSGYAGAPGKALGLAAGTMIVAGAVLFAWRGRDSEGRGALLPLGLAVVAGGATLALAVGGVDYFYHRNVLVLWILLAIVPAAGFATMRRAGAAGATLACLLFLAIHLAMVRSPERHRADWESAVASIGQSQEARGVVVAPVYADTPLLHYGVPLVEPPVEPLLVREIDVVGEIADPARIEPGRVIGGFTVVERDEHNGLWAASLRAPEPQPLPLPLGSSDGELFGASEVRVMLDPGAG